MGIIIGKFRKQKSTFDILEKLEKEIKSIEEFGRSTEQTRKKIVGRFVLLAILVYFVLASLLYLYYNNISPRYKLICIIPLIAVPLVIWIIKRFLTWYYSRKIGNNEKKLVTLKNEKKKILDNVMETETYKVAKKILDKFGNEPVTKPVIISTLESTPLASNPTIIGPSTLRPNQTALRQRHMAAQNIMRGRMSFGGPATPQDDKQLLLKPNKSPPFASRSVSGLSVVSAAPMLATPIPGISIPLTRSVLPRDRSVLDKMVDFLVGDGPSNRYALICNKCNSHNGMALKEEFEYLSFRCCYCSAFNPARKKRPSGPVFEANLSTTKTLTLKANSSDSDKDSMSDSEPESLTPNINKPRSDSPTSESEEQPVDTASVDSAIHETQIIDKEASTTGLMETSPLVETETDFEAILSTENFVSTMDTSPVTEKLPDEVKEVDDMVTEHIKED